MKFTRKFDRVIAELLGWRVDTQKRYHSNEYFVMDFRLMSPGDCVYAISTRALPGSGVGTQWNTPDMIKGMWDSALQMGHIPRYTTDFGALHRDIERYEKHPDIFTNALIRETSKFYDATVNLGTPQEWAGEGQSTRHLSWALAKAYIRAKQMEKK